jgi:lipopolysaccharide assembly protein A
MQFLKTLFWVLVAVIAVIFSFKNWTTIAINLWSGLVLETQLPVLLFGAFLVGMIPTLLLHRATRWSLRRKIDSMERSLSDVRPVVPTVVPSETLPPSAMPIAVPPGVS